MKKTTILLCSLILPLWVLAQQSEDYLVVDGVGHFVRADPLNRYLTYFCKAERVEEYVNNFIDPYWPDYTRHWELKDKRLYLVKIETDNKEAEYPLELLFPHYDGTPVEAKWFTGIVSSRLGDSPVIQLNHEFYEEESVIQFTKGVEVGRFITNHKERWISYSRRLMEELYPLAGDDPDAPVVFPVGGGMAAFLEDAFTIVTHPKEKPSIYYPIIQIEFNADLAGLQLSEADRKLNAYELLNAVVEETQAVLSTSITNRLVVYEIKEPGPAGSKSLTPLGTEHAGGGAPSE